MILTSICTKLKVKFYDYHDHAGLDHNVHDYHHDNPRYHGPYSTAVMVILVTMTNALQWIIKVDKSIVEAD